MMSKIQSGQSDRHEWVAHQVSCFKISSPPSILAASNYPPKYVQRFLVCLREPFLNSFVGAGEKLPGLPVGNEQQRNREPIAHYGARKSVERKPRNQDRD